MPTPYAIFAQHEQWSLIGVPVGFVDRMAIETQDLEPSHLDGQQSAIRNPQSAIEAAAPQGTANFIAKFDGSSNPTANSIMFDNGTNVGIGTTSPKTTYHLNITGSKTTASTSIGIELEGNTSANGATFAGMDFWNNGNRQTAIQAFNNGGATTSGLAFYTSRAGQVNTQAMAILGNGNVGIGTLAPQAKLHVAGGAVRVQATPPNDTTPDNAEFVLTNRGAGGAPYTWRLQTAAVGGGFGVNPNALEIWEYPQDATPGCCIPRLRILPGGNRGSAPAPVTIMENGTLQTSVLQIFGGGDLAEPFEISEADSIRPGLVVAIDPDRPGHLRMADRAYDRTVAGIVSGANGITPGLTMKQEGTMADGAHPVALTGRVYCWADASYGPIEPGNLLTTSNTPGHAMKVTGHAKAQGAIIGKAMTALAEGKGLVLVLVTLQ